MARHANKTGFLSHFVQTSTAFGARYRLLYQDVLASRKRLFGHFFVGVAR